MTIGRPANPPIAPFLDQSVGLGRDNIRLYASAETAPVVKVFRDKWGNTYKGFAVSVVLTDGFETHPQAS